ncbi:MAG: polysaccharide biosynthesis tyrosine autokinase [Bacteroidetes bacterium]|nr:polysaccharide biosynthesis tyrosine autokinase [Bacteroidota bacterium]
MSKTDYNVWENKSMDNETDINIPSKPRVNSIDIDFRRVLSVWPYIILFGVLGYLAGLIYLRYTEVVYNVSTSISIEEDQEVTIGQALFGNTRDPFNDKIAFFKSPTITAMLVDTLGLQYSAQAQGRFKNRDFYSLIKWYVIKDKPNEEVPDINFSIMPEKNGFTFKSDSVNGKSTWGVPFIVKGKRVVVMRLEDFQSQTPIYCYSRNRLSVAFAISRALTISTTKESNILNISYSDVSSDRAIDILNTLMRLNINIMEDDKSRTYSQAIKFIEQRLNPLALELDSIENSLARYKAINGITDISATSEMYLQKMHDYDKELTDITILKSTIAELENFIQNPSLKETDLSFVGITNNPTLQATLQNYMLTMQQREKLSLTATENNPALKLLDENITNMRSNMYKQVANYKSNLAIAEAAYRSHIAEASTFLKNAPGQEKEIIDKSRIKEIKATLYLTLLQKREEASIAKASVTVNTKLLFPPVKLNATLQPARSKVLIAAILVGLFLPLLFAILKEVLNRKVISKRQLQAMTNIPVIAELAQADNTEKLPFVIDGSQRSMFAEQIRSLRTNINFYAPASKPVHFILITSSVSGEGKSFLSMNLAKSYSMQGKKVALLEFDLRRPKITKALGVQTDSQGLSSVLIGKVNISDIIFSIGKDANEKFDFFPAGAIPPNPQELIAGEYAKKIRKYLEDNYEVVIIDTPPFGIVADAQILGQWADVTLIVTRFQQTVKEQVSEINEWQDRKLFKSIALVFNGVKNKGYFGNKYGYYYYKNKYGYSYYSGEDKKK